MDTILTIIVIVAFCALFAGIFIAIKKDKMRHSEIEANLTDEQKNRLQLAEVTAAQGTKYGWIKEALIVKITPAGNKAKIVAMYYNRTIQNATYNTFCLADFKADQAYLDEKGIKEGSYAKILCDPEKGAKFA